MHQHRLGRRETKDHDPAQHYTRITHLYTCALLMNVQYTMRPCKRIIAIRTYDLNVCYSTSVIVFYEIHRTPGTTSHVSVRS